MIAQERHFVIGQALDLLEFARDRAARRQGGRNVGARPRALDVLAAVEAFDGVDEAVLKSGAAEFAVAEHVETDRALLLDHALDRGIFE